MSDLCMKNSFKVGILGILSVFILGFLFSHSGCELYNDYESCINYYQLADKVSNIFANTATFNIDYNLYMDCVMEQKNQKKFNYNEIRDFCFSALTSKKPNFNLNCSHSLEGIILTVDCKGIYPTKDYELTFDLISDINSLNVKPNIILNSNYTLTKPEFVFTKKEFNIKDIPNANSNINILPLSIQIKDSADISFLNTSILSTDVDDIYKAYLDCLTIKGLFSKYDLNNFYIKNSGYEFILPKVDLIKSCVDDLRFSFIVDFENYDLKKNNFRNYLDATINEAISSNDYSTDFMSSYFETILDKYSEYLLSINKYKNEEKSLKLSLDPDYLFEHIIKITKNLSPKDKSIILESVAPTILKNKEDVISIRRKNSVNAIINFFNNDIKQIKDSEIVNLYTNIEEIVLKNHFKNNQIADVCDVNFVLTPKSISLNGFSLIC